MHIETDNKNIKKGDKEVFDFLTDLKNFEKLMPESTEKFVILDDDKFLFALKGMPEIVLKRKEQVPYSKIVLGAANDKLPFTLTAHIKAIDSNNSEVTLSFEGKFNAMMAMMVKKPITNFMETLSENLQNIHSV